MNMSLNFSAFIDGLSVFLIGISMVFVVLFLLILLIEVVGRAVSAIENKQHSSQEVNISTKEAAAKKEEIVSAVEDDLELVAVITTVIAASLGTTSDQLQVRSLRQVNRNRA